MSRNVTYFVHQDVGCRGESDEVGGEVGEVEAGRVEELEGGGEKKIENNLRQYESQEDRGLV